MFLADVIALVLFLLVILALVKPAGIFMARVFQGEFQFVKPLENVIFRIAGIDPALEMGWKTYALSMLLFNLLGIIVLFLILLFQGWLPLNPQGFSGFPWDQALNEAVSFVTNTNWQSYSGEAAASYFTQMVGFAVQNFLSAATGICIAIALIRGIARRNQATIGNFWVDMVRCTLYILLPVSVLIAIVLMSQGVIQNFSPYVETSVVSQFTAPDGTLITGQTLPMGPVASQEAIKEFGTNGGGFMNANSAHPYENPNMLTNLLEIFSLLIISFSLIYSFGYIVKDTRQSWAIIAVILTIMLVCITVFYAAESFGNPLLAKLGLTGPYMEGKEARFGLGSSILFAAATTGTSTGAVNTMHDSLTPLGGMIPLFLILLSEVVPGGTGSGLYTMLAYIIIGVFIAGLMIGRTPEYLGKKIEAVEMRGSIVIVLTSGLLVLVLTGIAFVIPAGTSSIYNPGPHGLTEIVYAFASMANNNGSAFAGLGVNTLFYNLTGALAMLLGRFIPAVAALAIAGSLASKKYYQTTSATLPTHSASFVIWIIFIIMLVGALTFFSILAVGPIVEHLLMVKGVTF